MIPRWFRILGLVLSLTLGLSGAVGAQGVYQLGGTLQSAAAATGNGSTLDTSLTQTLTLQVSGTFVGTITFEASTDGTNWATMTCYLLGSSSAVTAPTAPGLWRCNVLGVPLIRTRVSAYTSGTITVRAFATSLGPLPIVTP